VEIGEVVDGNRAAAVAIGHIIIVSALAVILAAFNRAAAFQPGFAVGMAAGQAVHYPQFAVVAFAEIITVFDAIAIGAGAGAVRHLIFVGGAQAGHFIAVVIEIAATGQAVFAVGDAVAAVHFAAIQVHAAGELAVAWGGFAEARGLVAGVIVTAGGHGAVAFAGCAQAGAFVAGVTVFAAGIGAVFRSGVAEAGFHVADGKVFTAGGGTVFIAGLAGTGVFVAGKQVFASGGVAMIFARGAQTGVFVAGEILVTSGIAAMVIAGFAVAGVFVAGIEIFATGVAAMFRAGLAFAAGFVAGIVGTAAFADAVKAAKDAAVLGTGVTGVSGADAVFVSGAGTFRRADGHVGVLALVGVGVAALPDGTVFINLALGFCIAVCCGFVFTATGVQTQRRKGNEGHQQQQ